MSALRELAELLASDRYSRQTLSDGTGVVLDLHSMRVLSLNRTGMFVLEEIAGGAGDFDTLERRLVEVFEVDRDVADSDLRDLLAQLDRHLRPPEAL